jgi:hypothetical protein
MGRYRGNLVDDSSLRSSVKQRQQPGFTERTLALRSPDAGASPIAGAARTPSAHFAPSLRTVSPAHDGRLASFAAASLHSVPLDTGKTRSTAFVQSAANWRDCRRRHSCAPGQCQKASQLRCSRGRTSTAFRFAGQNTRRAARLRPARWVQARLPVAVSPEASLKRSGLTVGLQLCLRLRRQAAIRRPLHTLIP